MKDAFLDEIRKSKKFFYGTVVAQAQRIDVEGDRVVFTFAPQHRRCATQLDQSADVAREPGVAAVRAEDDRRLGRRRGSCDKPGNPAGRRPVSRARRNGRIFASRRSPIPGVQAMLDVFAAEIKDVEERK